jgi:hypothetical protein
MSTIDSDQLGRLAQKITPRLDREAAIQAPPNPNKVRARQKPGEPTVLVVSKKDRSEHLCLVSAVPYAFQNGYELKDPKAYDIAKKAMRGEADDGQVVRPDGGSGKPAEAAVVAVPAEEIRAAGKKGNGSPSWAEAQREMRRRRVSGGGGEVVKPDGS